MDWLELKIDTSHAGLDAVTDMLEQQGVTGVMIDDEADFQSFLENSRSEPKILRAVRSLHAVRMRQKNADRKHRSSER